MKFTLHPHQADALEMLRASLMAGKRRPMVQAPTSFGKTILAAHIVEGALKKGKRATFLVPSISLIDQTVEKFAAHGIDAVGVMQGYHPLTDAAQPIQVASVQTLQRRRLPEADLVIIDEAHLRFRFVSEWMRREEWQRVPFVGLSATPWSKGLGQDYDDLLVAARMSDLIDRGFLAPFKVFAPSHPDLSKVRTKAGDYREDDLAEVMNQPTLIADAVSTWLRLGEDRPTLLFAVDRAHARKLAGEFEAAGVPTGYVDANTPREERDAIGRRLQEGQIKVVANVGCLTTGVDWPHVRCIILARPTKSEMLFVQIIGRGLRTDADKQDCLVLDHSDTTTRLGFPTDIHYDHLDDGKHHASTSKRREKPAPLPKECPKCSYLKPAGIHQCPSCGFRPERQSPIEEKQGELVQLKGRKKGKAEPTPHTKQEVFSMLLWIQQDRNYSPNFAKAKYMDRYGTWPNGLHREPMAPDATFLNWLKSRQIAYAKARQKAEKRNAA